MTAAAYAHRVTVRRDAAGRWIVTHSWLANGSQSWRHASKPFGTEVKAQAWAAKLRAAYKRQDSRRVDPAPIAPKSF